MLRALQARLQGHPPNSAPKQSLVAAHSTAQGHAHLRTCCSPASFNQSSGNRSGSGHLRRACLALPPGRTLQQAELWRGHHVQRRHCSASPRPSTWGQPRRLHPAKPDQTGSPPPASTPRPHTVAGTSHAQSPLNAAACMQPNSLDVLHMCALLCTHYATRTPNLCAECSLAGNRKEYDKYFWGRR